ncbi:hypothetical protein ACFVAV_26160 [Nocardia sp. NPDC057663]|uniref:hypothetical protein n=1 Tax=Nocardia sp. NPDC057663 TaxID=3346201 RepID=UPI00366B15CC
MIGTAVAVIVGLCALAVCSLLAGYAVVVVVYWLELRQDSVARRTPNPTSTSPVIASMRRRMRAVCIHVEIEPDATTSAAQ